MNRRDFISAAVVSITSLNSSCEQIALPEGIQRDSASTHDKSAANPPPSVVADIQLDEFIELSQYLTGESKLDAEMGADYLQVLASHSEFAALIPRLMTKYRQIRKQHDVEAAIKSEIMADAILRIPAEQIIYLWYLAALYVSNPLDPTNSATGIWQYNAPQHYKDGLVWSVLRAHAPMSYGGPFGYWKDPPK
jgi:hypothetical protein